MSWKLKEWTGIGDNTKPMSKKEIEDAVKYLRDNHYPIPEDCPMKNNNDIHCPSANRPACMFGICHVATKLCNDF